MKYIDDFNPIEMYLDGKTKKYVLIYAEKLEFKTITELVDAINKLSEKKRQDFLKDK